MLIIPRSKVNQSLRKHLPLVLSGIVFSLTLFLWQALEHQVKSDVALQLTENAISLVLVSGISLLILLGTIAYVAQKVLRESKEKHNCEERCQLAVKGNNDGMWDWNLETNEVFYSARWKEMLGYEDHEIKNNIEEWSLRLAQSDRPQVMESLQNHLEGKTQYYQSEHQLLCKDGSYKWILNRGQAIWDQTGKPLRLVTSHTDITEHKLKEQALESLVQELEHHNQEIKLLSNIVDLLQICQKIAQVAEITQNLLPKLFPDSSGGIFTFSESKTNLTMMTFWGESSISQTVFAPNDCICLRQGQPHLIEEENTELFCEHWLNRQSGAYLCIPMIAQGEIIGVFTFAQGEKLSENKKQLALALAKQIGLTLANLQLTEKLTNESIRDPLTGLYNRRYLEESLERELSRAKRNCQFLSVMMLDVDHFKYFNDTFGHDAGDEVLRELGKFLQQNSRREDIPCRYGGEELTLVLPGASLEDTRNRAEELRNEIKDLRVQRGRQSLYTITVSIGVACFPVHGKTAKDILQAADRALYQAKQEGRDRVVFIPI